MPGRLYEFADKISEMQEIVLRAFAFKQSNELFRGKITLPQFLITDFLAKQGTLKMRDLAEYMKVTTAAITGIVDRLVRQGYLRRKFDPDDRRIIKVGLTDKGQELIRKIKDERRQMIADLFSKLPEAEREDYLRILTHLKDLLHNGKNGNGK